MQDLWIQKCVNKIEKRDWVIFRYVFLIGFLVHAFVLTNNLANYDSVWYFHSEQDVTSSGRWFLQYAGGISSYFQLPMLNGVLGLVYISVAAVVVVKLLDIRNDLLGVLAGAALMTYPTVAQIFNFMYTADAYFLSMLLAAVAAYLMIKARWYYWILGGVFLGLSMGIYQSFLSVALVLLLLWMVKHTMIKREKMGIHILGIAVGLVTAVIVYMVGLTYRLKGGKLISYQGISDATLLHSVEWYFMRLINSFKDILHQILIKDVYQNKCIMIVVAFTWIIVLMFVAIQMISLIKVRKFINIFWGIMAVLLIPISVYCMNLLSEGVGYYSLMMSSISVVWILPIMIIDCNIFPDSSRFKKVFSNILVGCICINLWNYIIVDNISYLASSVSNDRSYALAERIVDRVEQAEGYEDMEYVYIYGTVDAEKYVDSRFQGKTLINDGIIPYGNSTYRSYINIYIGGKFIALSDNDRMQEIQDMEEFKNMPIWPAAGCVKIFDNVMVVRLAETE